MNGGRTSIRILNSEKREVGGTICVKNFNCE
jgi:hypothetical protein